MTALVLVAAVLALSPTRTGDEGRGMRLVQGGVGIVDPNGGEVIGRVALDGALSRVEVFGGAVWVSRAAGSVTRIDPDTGTIRQTIPTGSGTAGMAEGAGDIWVANTDAGTVSRIDPETNAVVQTIEVGNGPTDVAFLDGRVWVSNQLDGTLSELDARTGELAGTHPVAAAPTALASDGDSIWVTDQVLDALLQIDPTTARQLRR